MEAKQIVPPGRPSDLVDYLLARRDEPCGRSIPELIMKAICWMEQVAEFPTELRATQGRLAWAIKDRIVESLLLGAPLTKRAPRFSVAMLARLEELVVDEMYSVGWRIWAWIKLVKVWASLRWSDVQAILPQELRLIEGRLSTILRRTKTSGPNRQVKELPVCVSEKAYFAKPTWIKTGFDLLQFHVRYKRDYLVPTASYADAMVATAGLLSAMQLPQVTQGYWTEHSGRAVIPTGLSVLEAPPSDKDILGRWKPEESDTYARSYGGRVARLQAVFAEAARSPGHYEVLDEREIASGLKDWLIGKDKLNLQRATHLSEELALQWKRPLGVPRDASEVFSEEGASVDPLEEPSSGDGSHKDGCKLCWPPKADDGDSESGEASSAHTGDGEEPWFEATWEGWGSGFGPSAEGAGEPTIPQIDTATGIDFNQSLNDFIRERM